MNFIYSLNDYNWLEAFEILQKYYEYNKNTLVPINFKTKNGIDYDEDGFNIGKWVKYYRENKDKLSTQKIELLNKVDFIFSINDSKWEHKYNLIKKFYEHYNHSNVPQNFKTKDGINYSEYGEALGIWARNQRVDKEFLSFEKIELLKSIDFVFDLIEYKWLKNYEQLLIFFKENNHSLVPYNYKRSNISLGAWTDYQRKNRLSLTNEQINLLNKVNFIFSIKENAEEIKKLCIYYDMEFKKEFINYPHSLVKEKFESENNVTRKFKKNL